MMENMQVIIDSIKTAAPVVWDAAYRQVYIDIFEDLIGAVICFVSALWLIRIPMKRDNWNELKIESVAQRVSAIALSFLFLMFLATALEYLLNPRFAAIKEILSLLSQK